jgi:cytosine deaminase
MSNLPPLDLVGLGAALKQARKSLSEGGIPIGAALVSMSQIPQVLGSGHNRRIQESSPILHGETAALNDAGRLKADVYRNSTMVESCPLAVFIL